MRSPQALRNGENLSPHPRMPQFHSTVSVQKLRRFNSLVLVFRLAAFCFSFAASVFMLTNSHGSASPHWYDFDAFRYPPRPLFGSFLSSSSVWFTRKCVFLMSKNQKFALFHFKIWIVMTFENLFRCLLVSPAHWQSERKRFPKKKFCFQTRRVFPILFRSKNENLHSIEAIQAFCLNWVV